MWVNLLLYGSVNIYSIGNRKHSLLANKSINCCLCTNNNYFICAFYYFRYLKLSFYTSVDSNNFIWGINSSVLYYNFTWSFYGDLLIILPLSLWGMERFFQRRKIGLFIFAVAITLFSNFYFTLLSSHCVRYLFYITCRIPISP